MVQYLVVFVSLLSVASSSHVCNEKPAINGMFRIYDRLYLQFANITNLYIVYNLQDKLFLNQTVSKQDIFIGSYGYLFQRIVSAMLIEGTDYYNHRHDQHWHRLYSSNYGGDFQSFCNPSSGPYKDQAKRKKIRIWGYLNDYYSEHTLTHQDFYLTGTKLEYCQQDVKHETQNVLWNALQDPSLSCVLPFGDTNTVGFTRFKNVQYLQVKLKEAQAYRHVGLKRQSLNMSASDDHWTMEEVPRIMYHKNVVACVELNHSAIFLSSDYRSVLIFSRRSLIGDCAHQRIQSEQNFFELSLYSLLCEANGLLFDSSCILERILTDWHSTDSSDITNPSESSSSDQHKMMHLLLTSFCVGVFVFSVLISILIFVKKVYLE